MEISGKFKKFIDQLLMQLRLMQSEKAVIMPNIDIKKLELEIRDFCINQRINCSSDKLVNLISDVSFTLTLFKEKYDSYIYSMKDKSINEVEEIERITSERPKVMKKLHRDFVIIFRQARGELYEIQTLIKDPDYYFFKMQSEIELIKSNEKSKRPYFEDKVFNKSTINKMIDDPIRDIVGIIDNSINFHESCLHIIKEDKGGRHFNIILKNYVWGMAGHFQNYFGRIRNYKKVNPDTGKQIQNSKLFHFCKTCLKICLSEDNYPELYQIELPNAVEAYIKENKKITKI